MSRLKNSTGIYQLIWNGSLFDKKPSLVSEYKTDEQGFDGRLILHGKQLIENWPLGFNVQVQGTQAVDYFLCAGFYDVISDPVRRIIQECSGNNDVEFLPIKVELCSTQQEIGPYWVLNVISKLEALDWEQTIWATGTIPYSDIRAYSRVIKPAFKLESAKNATIFHLSVQGKTTPGIYLSAHLKVAMEQAQCTLGMEFAPIKTTP